MPGELQRTVGRAFRAERLRRGLSQEVWGEVLGVDRTYAGAIERGERNLTLRTVERLAERAEVEVRLTIATAVSDRAEPEAVVEGGVVLRAAHDGTDPGAGS